MKKTLLIDARTGSDWSLDLLFAGLVRKFGPENVIDYPNHLKHREGVPRQVGDPEKDWGFERRSLGYTPRYMELGHHNLTDINWLIQQGQIERIFLDERLECYELYLKTHARFYDIPVVVVAGHDKFWNAGLHILDQCYGRNLEKIFVDNWGPWVGDHPKAVLFNWSTNFDHFWDSSKREELLSNKIYDISFMGYNSHPDRARIIDHIEHQWGSLKKHIVLERKSDTFNSFVPKAEFFRVMAQSKLCLNLRGAAENGKTLRFYEIPYVGSAMLTQDTGAVQTHQFVSGQHALYFDGLGELDQHIDWALSCSIQREMMAKLGHEHAMKYHTVDARTEQMYAYLGR